MDSRGRWAVYSAARQTRARRRPPWQPAARLEPARTAALAALGGARRRRSRRASAQPPASSALYRPAELARCALAVGMQTADGRRFGARRFHVQRPHCHFLRRDVDVRHHFAICHVA